MSTYNYLDKTGLSIVWDKVKGKITSAISSLVSGPSSATSGNVAIFNGTTGKIIKDSGFTIKKSVPSNAVFTDTTYTAATGAPPNISTTSSVGISTNYARQDHTHAITLASGDSNGQIKIAGSNVSVKGLKSAAFTDSGTYSTATYWQNGTQTGSVEMVGSTTDGIYAVAEGEFTTSTGEGSHSEGLYSVASGSGSHAEGIGTAANGDYSHAEGDSVYANGISSHAEGSQSIADGDYSHAEGEESTASGYASHAEGNSTASGTYSHAEGTGTVANHKSQHAFGEYNTEDVNSNGATSRGTYVEMVGNGTSATNRSNARTLDWEGNEVLSGSMTVGAKAKLQYNSTTEALDFIFV